MHTNGEEYSTLLREVREVARRGWRREGGGGERCAEADRQVAGKLSGRMTAAKAVFSRILFNRNYIQRIAHPGDGILDFEKTCHRVWYSVAPTT